MQMKIYFVIEKTVTLAIWFEVNLDSGNFKVNFITNA